MTDEHIMRMFAGLPSSVAGRVECILSWMVGLPILDENGEPTGEYTEPVISRETALRLLEMAAVPAGGS